MFKKLHFTILICALAIVSITNAQEVRLINNKGTIENIRNNNVYTSPTDPVTITTNDVVEGDVWFDNSDPNNIITKIYDGANWLLVNTKVGLLQDADGDTKVQVEETADEDIIRFDTAGTERVIINNAGNVGIGMATPGSKLSFGTSFGDMVRFYDGGSSGLNTGIGVNSGNFQFYTSNGSAFTWNNGGDLQPFGTNEFMRINNNGNVGIGTTTPSAHLDISGNGNNGRGLRVTQTATSKANGVYTLEVDNSAHTSNLTTAGALNVKVNSGDAFTVAGTGNVGIGITTPANKLTVATNQTGGSDEGITIQNTANGWGGSLSFNVPGSGGYDTAQVTSTNDGNGGRLNLRTANTSGVLQNHLSIVNSGNVGIGIITPTQKLDVLGSARIDEFIFDENNQKGTTGQILSTTATGIDWVNAPSTALIQDADTDTKIQVEEGTDDDTIRFDTAGVERVIITDTGNVGIGTTAPLGKLDVSDGTNPLSIDSDTYNEIQSYNRPLIINRQGNNVGIGTTTPGSKLSFGANLGDVVRFYDGGSPGLNTGIGVNGGNFQFYTSNGSGFTWNNGGDLQPFGTNEFMRINSNGNVGIGTTTPGALLEIGKNSSTSSSIRFTSSADQSSLRFTSSATANYIQSGVDYTGDSKKNLIFSSINGGTNWLSIQGTTGNVGIGTISPTQKLDVLGSARIDQFIFDENNESGTTGQILSTTATGIDWVNAPSTALIQDADTDTKIQVEETADEDIIRFDTAGTERVIINNVGNVGIGTTTPIYKLDSRGEVGIELFNVSGGGDVLNFRPSLGDANKYNLSISSYDHSGGGVGPADGLSINGFDGISFATGSSTTRQEKVRINANGNVGIGTTTPSAHLDISGNGNNGRGLRVTQTATSKANGVYTLEVDNSAHTSNLTNAGALNVKVNSGDAFTVAGTGNVGIGTTAPANKLTVATIQTGTSDEGITIQNTANGWGGSLSFNIPSNGGYNTAQVTSTNDGNGGRLNLRTADTSGALQNHLSIVNSGNVGIGITTPTQKLDVLGSARIDQFIFDENNQKGTAGQILSTTATGIDWVNAPSTALIQDADTDTKIQVEETADEDIIRFDTAGSERMTINNLGRVEIVGDVLNTSNPALSIKDNETYDFDNLNATSSHLDNYINRASLSLLNNNNGMFFLTSGTLNERKSGIQAGHANTDFASSTGSLLLNPFSGNVGIGTTDPTSQLHVNGGTVYWRNINNEISLTTPSGQTGIVFNANQFANRSRFNLINWSNGTEADRYFILKYDTDASGIAIRKGGNVGIGTISPTQKLDVLGSARIDQFIFDENNESGTTGQILSTTATGIDWVNAPSTALIQDADTDTKIQVEETADDDTIRFDTAGTERMVITPTGNINLTTANRIISGNTGLTLQQTGDTFGSTALHIRNRNGENGATFEQLGSVDLIDFAFRTLSNQMNLRVEDRAGFVSFADPEFQFITNTTLFANLGINGGDPALLLHNGTTGGSVYFGNTAHGVKRNFASTVNDVGLFTTSGAIRLSTNGETPGEFVLTDTGNVGIGTTTPTQRLDVLGSARIDQFIFDENNESGTTGQILSTTATGIDWVNVPSTALIQDADTDTKIQVEEGTDDDTIRFDTAGTERAVISATGNVGIGTTAPTETLDVRGGAHLGVMPVFNTEGTVKIGRADDAAIRFHEIKARNGNSASTNWMQFNIHNAASTSSVSNVLTLRGDERVGISTTAPTNKLTINADIVHDNNFNYSTAQQTIFDPNTNGGNSPNGTRDILHLVREGIGSQAFGNKASFALGRYENVGTRSRSQLDIKLTDGSFDAHNTIMSLRSNGNVGIGNTAPNTNAILDLTNTQNKAFLLPTETLPTNVSAPVDGMLVYSTNNNNAYLRADSAWKPIAYNTVTNELIFDGDDDAPTANDNYYYVSFVVNGDWKVIRYDKTDVNVEDEATITNNTGVTSQPTTLAACTALNF